MLFHRLILLQAGFDELCKLGKMRQRVLDNIPTQKLRGDLFDPIVQNPVVVELIRKKKYDQAEQLESELIERKLVGKVNLC